MELSSPRFKSLAVTAGFSFWFFIITTVVGIFSLEFFAGFVVILLIVTQIFALKLSKGLDIFAVINTKIFLDCAFFGTTLDRMNVYDEVFDCVAFSLSKCFLLGGFRAGIVFGDARSDI